MPRTWVARLFSSRRHEQPGRLVRPHLLRLEDRAVPANTLTGQGDIGQFAVAAGSTGAVTVYNPVGPPAYTVNPFGPGVPVRAVMADVTGDGVPDVVAGTGPGVASEVVVINGSTRQAVLTLHPFESAFTGGVFVAAGDMTGDGKADVVVSPDLGGGPRVEVFNGATGGLMASFFGIVDPSFRGGARVAVGDVNGDGTPDLAVAAGYGGGPRVAVYDGRTVPLGSPTKLVNDFFAFEETVRNGAYVAVGDVNGDGKADLVFGGGPTGGPRVEAVDAAALLLPGGPQVILLANFFAGPTTLRDGAQVAVKRLTAGARADLVVAVPAPSGTQVSAYSGATLSPFGVPTTSLNLGTFNDPLGVYVG